MIVTMKRSINMIGEILEESIKNANNANNTDKCSVNEDGIRVCNRCKQPKQVMLEFPRNSGKLRPFPIKCLCDEEEEEARKAEIKRMKTEELIKDLYRQGLSDKAYRANTFSKDDNRNPKLSRFCQNYVRDWDKHRANNRGILFYGNTGGGKSFFACCIANALIQKGIPVLYSRLSDLVKNRVDKNSQEISLRQFELIILDDIGVENSTQTAYTIIDDIYRAGIPLIVTTNLSPSELKEPDTIEKQRIYGRIIERCCLTKKVDVTKSRLDMAKENANNADKTDNTDK